ncbi:hypothetical protein AMECASPLE_007118 [Ameca splendens]|uniref:Uncharacterized protein n=1 Tax=Ameca splendens TaxID=208324 RepID=A0ABV0Z8D4_9TELE
MLINKNGSTFSVTTLNITVDGPALCHSEDPEGYLRQRPLACLLISEGNCMIAVGTTSVTTFDQKDLFERLLYLIVYYCALHLTYPKCISISCKLKYSKTPSMTEIQPPLTRRCLVSGSHLLIDSLFDSSCLSLSDFVLAFFGKVVQM